MSQQATLGGEPLSPAAESAARDQYAVETDIQRGDLILLGRHRLLCGNSTMSGEIDTLLDGAAIDCLLTDPPYCSGGFQEAGRTAGSIGCEGGRHKILYDTLSTRGYQTLLRGVLDCVAPMAAYLFTDWRMWVTLSDLVEMAGYGVRQMIVWNKGAMGMGTGWRSQHELILHARLSGAEKALDLHYSRGNVLSYPRTGNKYHPTEKPIGLIKDILYVTQGAATICDPFAGSGTTILACEEMARTCYAMELSPAFCQIATNRWERQTGERAEIIPGQNHSETPDRFAEAAP